MRGPSRGAVAPRSIEHRRRRPLARARPRRGTGLEPERVAGRKQLPLGVRRSQQRSLIDEAHRRVGPS